ncbi:HEPN domain-containing protein [Microbacterium sp. Mu-80]|uniref:HEPN domain-containing protein n=1 Tax=Microbacterium bandirmense TaxID=3122050 RepID=A0ABU8LFN0_9MICO
MNSFSVAIGQWWLVDSPLDRVSGVIDWKFVDDRLTWTLLLDGSLPDPNEPGYSEGRTLHGITSAGKLTLMHAHPVGPFTHRTGFGERALEHISQTWEGFTLLQGDHVTDVDLFTRASFTTSHLWDWIGPSRLNQLASERRRVSLEEPGPWLEADLGDDRKLALATYENRIFGRTKRSSDTYGMYQLHAPNGMRVEEIRDLAFRLTSLHAIVMDTPSDVQELTFGETAEKDVVIEINPRRPGSEDQPGELHDPLFDTWEIGFPHFIQRWLELTSKSRHLMSAATPRKNGMTVESMLIETCNGLESLAEVALTAPGLRQADQETLEKLKAAGLNSAERRDYKNYLEQRRWTLQDRLVALAETLGEESAEWLFGAPLSNWAGAVSRLRNALTHGAPLRNDLMNDFEFVGSAEQSTTLLLRLALLKHVGYANQRSDSPDELLRSNGRRVAGHPNSRLFNECRSLARYAGRWHEWHDRLER